MQQEKDITSKAIASTVLFISLDKLYTKKQKKGKRTFKNLLPRQG